MSRSHYNPNPAGYGRRRDKSYPSEVASQRPAFSTRIDCELGFDEGSPRETLRGRQEEELYPPLPETPEPGLEDRVARFNRELRAGHGFRNDDEG